MFDNALNAAWQARALKAEALIEQLTERLKATMAYDATEAERIQTEELDVDAPGDYSIEADCAESYHSGRAEAIGQVLDILLGREVTFYSETL